MQKRANAVTFKGNPLTLVGPQLKAGDKAPDFKCVTGALKTSQVERVAANPAPNCVLMQMGESFGSYAVRYWLTDIAVDDPTDSDVRTVIYFALQRAGRAQKVRTNWGRPARRIDLSFDRT